MKALTQALALMPSEVGQNAVQRSLAAAGITIDGRAPWDIRVVDARFYDHVVRHGALGFGEAYMWGWWDCEAIDQLVHRLSLVQKERSRSLGKVLHQARIKLLNLQSRTRAGEVIDAHYDLSNEMFEQWLDPYMQYSSGYWKDATTLEEAQEQKLDLICRKLQLKPSDHVLEIGCGWGGLAKYMASRYGCRVTAVNISKQQIAYARRMCEGLPVEIRECDYRDITGTYDKVVSIEMLEAVGYKNYRPYMEVAHRCLKENGTFLLHTIGENQTRLHGDRWILKYIFPNGHIPSIEQIGQAAQGLFVMEDWHNFGLDYDKTLMAWEERFEANQDRVRALDPKFDETFRRMWRYYLLNCAGAFRGRALNVWQLVFTRFRSGTQYPVTSFR